MKSVLVKCFLNFILVFMVIFSPFSQAQIGSVTASSSPSRFAITSSGQSIVRWSIVENVANPGLIGVSSSNGVFLAPDNSVLGTVNKTLQATKMVAVMGATTFAFTESVFIPQSIIRSAQKKGFSRFTYTRQFTDSPDNSNQTSSVNFTITGGGAANELSIRQVEMEFDDTRISEVIGINSILQAHAILSYNGTGLLDYSWEVASPPSTQGQVIFVTLTSRRQYLLAGQRVILQSPNLPTSSTGEYLVRLRINQPAQNFNLPVLRYAVNNNSGSPLLGTSISTLNVIQPVTDILLTPDTLFSWEPVPSAVAYQLDIYTQPVRDAMPVKNKSQLPITGVLVPATTTQLKINGLPRAHLMAGRSYYWRVIALTESGNLAARSEFRQIKF